MGAVDPVGGRVSPAIERLIRAAERARDAIEIGDEQQREEASEELAEVLLDVESERRIAEAEERLLKEADDELVRTLRAGSEP